MLLVCGLCAIADLFTLPTVYRGTEFCDVVHVRVCLYVCLFASISPELHCQCQFYYACYLWLWLGTLLAALR